jgi:hypothetical protein
VAMTLTLNEVGLFIFIASSLVSKLTISNNV